MTIAVPGWLGHANSYLHLQGQPPPDPSSAHRVQRMKELPRAKTIEGILDVISDTVCGWAGVVCWLRLTVRVCVCVFVSIFPPCILTWLCTRISPLCIRANTNTRTYTHTQTHTSAHTHTHTHTHACTQGDAEWPIFNNNTISTALFDLLSQRVFFYTAKPSDSAPVLVFSWDDEFGPLLDEN